MADGTRMTQMQRGIDSMQHQLGQITEIKHQVVNLSEIKMQMEALTATMNSLLNEKTTRLDMEETRQFNDYHEGENSGGSRNYHNRFNRMDFPQFDGDNPAN